MEHHDMEELRRLVHLYSYHLDRFELEPLLSLWTNDAVFDERPVGLGVHQGIDQIRLSFTEIFKVMASQVHYVTNLVVLEHGGQWARGVAYYLVEGVVRAGGTVHATGFYEDDYRKEEGAWRIQARKACFFNPPDLGAYVAGTAAG